MSDYIATVLRAHRWMGTRRYVGRCRCGWTSRAHFRAETCIDEHEAHVTDLLAPATRDLPEPSED